jgi:hypothetical protein
MPCQKKMGGLGNLKKDHTSISIGCFTPGAKPTVAAGLVMRYVYIPSTSGRTASIWAVRSYRINATMTD